jgi:Fibronectin type III domain
MAAVTGGVGLALTLGAGQAWGQASLELHRVISTTPFANSSVSLEDGEGMAYIPANNTLWLGEDQTDAIYEVDRTSGNLLSVITQSDLANAVRLGGTTLAGPDRAEDIEALAYDAAHDILYVFSTDCCPNPPTAFRLVRSSPTQPFQVETYQPLTSGFDFTGAAFHPTEGLYVSGSGDIRPYNYVTNTLGPPVALDDLVSGTIFGMGFSADGHDLWIVTSADKVYHLDWATKTVVPGHVFDLIPHGITDARAVDFINGQLYVLDGAEQHQVFVFNVGGALGAPSNLTATAGNGQIDLAWADHSIIEDGFEVQRCLGTVATTCGPAGNFAPIASVGPNVTVYSDLNAVNGETFTYRVRAFTGSAFSGFSNAVTTMAGPPDPPENLTATAISGTRIDLAWTDASENESGFSIELCAAPPQNCPEAGFGEIATVGAGITTYSDVGLVPNTTYSYRVRAFNDVGDSAAAGPAAATTLPQVNLLANGSFETDANGDTRPDAWSTAGAFTRSGEVIRSGSFAGKHFTTTNGQYTIKQNVSVTAGVSYSFTGCTNIPPSTDVFTFRFHLRWLTGSGGIVTQKTLKTYTAPTAGAWDCATVDALVAPTGATQAEVRMVAESINLTIYVDDLVFEVQ